MRSSKSTMRKPEPECLGQDKIGGPPRFVVSMKDEGWVGEIYAGYNKQGG